MEVTMVWKLFLDDDCHGVRHPSITVENPDWRNKMSLPLNVPDTAYLGDWKLAVSVEEAVQHVLKNGMPSFVSFDHDLADGKDGITFAHWMIAQDLNAQELNMTGRPREGIPHDFSFEVHSGNPVGRKNIRSLLENYLSFRASEADTQTAAITHPHP
jgi:hypothetical protein